MSSGSTFDKHISDGARVKALLRAMESERPDALFHDPYARLLAGERGEEILGAMPQRASNAWTLVVRTKVFDDFILQTVASGIDTVLNLAAELDTRPYRLPLPPSLRWIEIDYPEMLAYKEQKLAHAQPVCVLTRIGLDLKNRDARKTLFVKVSQESKQVLVITEGLLVYLTAEQAVELATDVAMPTNFHWWLISLSSPYLLKKRKESVKNEAMNFAPEEGGKFFLGYGWTVAEARFTLVEARRLKRTMPVPWFIRLLRWLTFQERREMARQQGGYILLERSS
jgi:methyltransferase (TIGR00027 family)